MDSLCSNRLIIISLIINCLFNNGSCYNMPHSVFCCIAPNLNTAILAAETLPTHTSIRDAQLVSLLEDSPHYKVFLAQTQYKHLMQATLLKYKRGNRYELFVLIDSISLFRFSSALVNLCDR